MHSFGFRVLLLFVIFLLIFLPCVHAHPDSSNSYDPMDWDFFAFGGQFAEAVANDEIAHMVSATSLLYIHMLLTNTTQEHHPESIELSIHCDSTGD